MQATLSRAMLQWFVLILCVSGTTAQRNGTIPVPVKWLMDNADKMVGVHPQGPENNSIIKPDTILEAGTYRPCALEWKSTKPKDRVLVFVPLGDMNPQRLTVSESDKVAKVGTGFWSVTMFTTNRKKTVAWSTSKGLYNSNEVRIVLPDKNTAGRFERALGDAIKLCGGKPDTPEPY